MQSGLALLWGKSADNVSARTVTQIKARILHRYNARIPYSPKWIITLVGKKGDEGSSCKLLILKLHLPTYFLITKMAPRRSGGLGGKWGNGGKKASCNFYGLCTSEVSGIKDERLKASALSAHGSSGNYFLNSNFGRKFSVLIASATRRPSIYAELLSGNNLRIIVGSNQRKYVSM